MRQAPPGHSPRKLRTHTPPPQSASRLHPAPTGTPHSPSATGSAGPVGGCGPLADGHASGVETMCHPALKAAPVGESLAVRASGARIKAICE